MKHSKIFTKKQIRDAIKHTGKDPINPIGMCFDNTALELMKMIQADKHHGCKVVHGIVLSNMPSDPAVGHPIGHAWLEKDGFHWDTTWGVRMPIESYFLASTVLYKVEYNVGDFLILGIRNNHSGPYDEKIWEVTKLADEKAGRRK